MLVQKYDKLYVSKCKYLQELWLLNASIPLLIMCKTRFSPFPNAIKIKIKIFTLRIIEMGIVYGENIRVYEGSVSRITEKITLRGTIYATYTILQVRLN